MIGRLSLTGTLALLILMAILPTRVDAQVPVCESFDGCARASTAAAGFRASATKSDSVPNRGTPATHGDAPGRTSWIELKESIAPACIGNGPDADDLCPGAVSTCPEGQIRWWIWHQETTATRDPATGEVNRVVGEQRMLPGSYCLGSDDPGVPDYGRAISLVQAGFKDLPLPGSAVQAAPAPHSLVNFPTAFFAAGEQSYSQTVTPVPGIAVTVTARPIQWVWTWGDGTTGTFTTPGVPKRPVVSHLYDQARDYEASVAVSWKGSFKIAGSAQAFEIPTPAIVQSPPVTVQVREARTQLVAR